MKDLNPKINDYISKHTKNTKWQGNITRFNRASNPKWNNALDTTIKHISLQVEWTLRKTVVFFFRKNPDTDIFWNKLLAERRELIASIKRVINSKQLCRCEIELSYVAQLDGGREKLSSNLGKWNMKCFIELCLKFSCVYLLKCSVQSIRNSNRR